MVVQNVLVYLAAIIAICIAAHEERTITCNTGDDCTKHNLVCLNGVCRCEKGERISSWTSTPEQTEIATCEIVFGGDCESNNDCKELEGSVCSDKKCICNGKYFPDIEDRLCVTAADPNQPCNTTLQCTITMSHHAICEQNVCMCKSGHYVNTDKQCVQSKNLGEQCTLDDECLKDGNVQLHCKDGECSGASYNVALSVATTILIVCSVFLQ